jgi:hypothetical protein
MCPKDFKNSFASTIKGSLSLLSCKYSFFAKKALQNLLSSHSVSKCGMPKESFKSLITLANSSDLSIKPLL